MLTDDIYSRSRLAGYQPEILFGAIVLIVGAGALGQNLALNLALSGIGEIDIVDFDIFEPHNVTRSPLYPNAEESLNLGSQKARIVSHKLLPMMTASSPKVRYATTHIQAIGDLPLARADLIFSAVDSSLARAYLAERCRVVQRPLFEGGFYADSLNLSIFGPNPDEPCYRCINPKKDRAFSCTQSALQMEKEQIIPALQNTAAVLAGIQAEAAIQWLHGDRSLRNKFIHANIRQMSMKQLNLERSSNCPGIHWHSGSNPLIIEAEGNDPLFRLLKSVEKVVGPAEVRFPEPLVIRNFCAICGDLVEANIPEWLWLASPKCLKCGGIYKKASDDGQLSSLTSIRTDELNEITCLLCKDIGLPSGTTFEVWPETPHSKFGERCVMRLQGTINQLTKEVSR